MAIPAWDRSAERTAGGSRACRTIAPLPGHPKRGSALVRPAPRPLLRPRFFPVKVCPAAEPREQGRTSPRPAGPVLHPSAAPLTCRRSASPGHPAVDLESGTAAAAGAPRCLSPPSCPEKADRPAERRSLPDTGPRLRGWSGAARRRCRVGAGRPRAPQAGAAPCTRRGAVNGRRVESSASRRGGDRWRRAAAAARAHPHRTSARAPPARRGWQQRAVQRHANVVRSRRGPASQWGERSLASSVTVREPLPAGQWKGRRQRAEPGAARPRAAGDAGWRRAAPVPGSQRAGALMPRALFGTCTDSCRVLYHLRLPQKYLSVGPEHWIKDGLISGCYDRSLFLLFRPFFMRSSLRILCAHLTFLISLLGSAIALSPAPLCSSRHTLVADRLRGLHAIQTQVGLRGVPF